MSRSHWSRLIPIAGVAIALAWPFARYAVKLRSEAAALEVLEDIRAAQVAFQTAGGRGAFAVSTDSLTVPCEGTSAVLPKTVLTDLAGRGYEVILRTRDRIDPNGVDCHGRPTAPDYYVGVQPISDTAAGLRAYAATAHSEPFAFFDGLAPRESDFGPGGLAVPVTALTTFRIP